MSGWTVVPQQPAQDTSAWTPVEQPLPPPESEAKISAQPKGVGSWLEDLESDIRRGTGFTLPGRALQSLGAPGTAAGVSPGASDYLASPVLGPVHAAQGLALAPSHPAQGALKTASGLLETATIPSSFMAPEVGEAATQGAQAAAKLVPSAKRAGAAIGEVEQTIGHLPVETSQAMIHARRMVDLTEAGHGNPPAPVAQFLKRMAVKFEGEQATRLPARLTFQEARDMYSAARNLTRNQLDNLTGKMGSEVIKFASALGDSLQNAAQSLGQGEKYAAAMKEYRNAKTVGDVVDVAKRYGIRIGLGGLIGGAAAKVGYDTMSALNR